MIFRLARMKAELLVTPIHSRDATTTDSVTRAIDARRKVASAGDLDLAYVNPSIPNSWYNELIPSRDNSAHESLRNKEFTESFMGIEVSDPWPRLAVPSSERIPNVIKGQAYVVFAPSASSPQRIWPPEYFLQLAE